MSSLIRREQETSTKNKVVSVQVAGDEVKPVAHDCGFPFEKILCPTCRRRLFSRNEDVVRLRTRILVFENGNAFAKCKHCRKDVMVPLVMREIFSEECLPLWNEALHGETR
jgi:uncharacterized protein with PIN domain